MRPGRRSHLFLLVCGDVEDLVDLLGLKLVLVAVAYEVLVSAEDASVRLADHIHSVEVVHRVCHNNHRVEEVLFASSVAVVVPLLRKAGIVVEVVDHFDSCDRRNSLYCLCIRGHIDREDGLLDDFEGYVEDRRDLARVVLEQNSDLDIVETELDGPFSICSRGEEQGITLFEAKRKGRLSTSISRFWEVRMVIHIPNCDCILRNMSPFKNPDYDSS